MLSEFRCFHHLRNQLPWCPTLWNTHNERSWGFSKRLTNMLCRVCVNDVIYFYIDHFIHDSEDCWQLTSFSAYFHCQVSYKIPYPFPNCNSCNVEVWEWKIISPKLYWACGYLSMLGLKLLLVLQRDPRSMNPYPDSKVHGAKMGPTWVLSAPDGPHVDPMNLAIMVAMVQD